ncbi:MAG: ATP-dependent zinc metalloprotease FtsH [Candidatus Nomurabacteria bacterium GW2011_GWA1_46_11]|uniref:ATP-dependent zinc metalloprotease FtsH n=3 Tax=Patescibacteria group TaxID=1783273 RepID=A0A1G1YY36_9BACT|nr:MAG: ATP-dependent zinc metalloprotease FtsH [Parcubacteria group bacterium GW2011_GWA2_46_10]KKU21426.1 MAG: ATP-dependent zinc metalloprotease FtsH [Candidatus Nomurabacteria bacterium GW2011_GWA1_46_11]OGY56327.1 MAG: cell division protein FtsH [Candidatus Colwellbacteria bacterium GWA2_46_10]
MEKNLYKSIFRGAVILISVALVFSLFYQVPVQAPEKVGISEVVNLIGEGKVSSIEVSGDQLNIQLQDETKLISQKEAGVGITETLVNLGVSPSQLATVKIEAKDESGARFWMGVLIPTVLPLIIFVAIFYFIFRQAKGGVNQAFSFGRSNLSLFTNFKDKISFKDVAGLKEAKQELEEIVGFLKEPKKYLDIGAKIPRGVLLMGAPGTGKTLLARAVAGEAGVPFFHISASEFVEMFVGVGASRTRDAFSTAKKAAPSILFIDEIDAVGRERGAGLGGGHDEREQTLNQILVEMDGFERDSRVIVLAATNRPDVLDQALLRPGRFDRRVMLDLPDIREREEILKIHSQNKPLDESVNLRQIATRTPGFSGADLANLINEAAILAVQKGKKKVAQTHIYDSIEKVILGPARKSRLVSDKEREITAYHEAGHALVAAGLKDSDPVHKVSIVSRGRAGGYTLKLPTEDRRLKTKSQFLADLAVAMGGYVAEQETFKEISTGASSDLQEATRLARLMVTRYGMSENLGPGVFGKDEDFVFLGREIGHTKDYSEVVAGKIDEEISNFLKRGLEKAQKIISAHKAILKKIADTLIQKEVLEQEEFEKLIGGFKLKPVAF